MDLTPVILLVVFGLQTAVPIGIAAEGELVTEKSGILNIGIYGAMLIPAFVAAAVNVALGRSLGADSAYVGVAAAMVAGAGLNFVFAFLSTKIHVDQVIAGIGINIFAVGITYVFLERYYTIDGTPNGNTIAPLFSVGGLANGVQIAISPLVAVMFIVPILVFIFLRRSKLGLHIRAVGENPKAAEAAGIDVAKTRMLATSIGGLLLGLGGAYFTVDYNPNFTPDPTQSVIPAFIALAAVIAGGWEPGYVLGMSILFGVTAALQPVLDLTSVQDYLLFTLPYIVTVAALGIAAKRLRPPAALGAPYKKE
ncbi:MAG: ABC transporter permease [Nitrososphaerota archaeon]|nr:ABC transporter permease [Nitrososphaerota archaeon]